MNQFMNISVSTGTMLRVVIVIVGAWLFFYLRDLVLILLTAVVIASAIEPAILALGRWRIPRVIAVVLIYLFIIAAVAGIFYSFVPSVLHSIAEFTASLPTYLEIFNGAVAFDEYTRALGYSTVSITPSDMIAQLREGLNLGAFGNAFTAVTSIFGGAASLGFIIVFSFYFAVVETGVDDFLRIIAPDKYRAYVLDLWKRSQKKIGFWMQGQVLLGVLIGVLVYLGLTILGVPHALLLAVLAALFELIPVFGPILASVPAVLIGFVDGGMTLGFLVIALYLIIQQFENHLIYPLVVTKVVGVPPLLVILALIVGAKLAGFLGILLSVPIAAAIQEFVADVQNRRVGLPAPESEAR